MNVDEREIISMSKEEKLSEMHQIGDDIKYKSSIIFDYGKKKSLESFLYAERSGKLNIHRKNYKIIKEIN